MSKGTQVVTFRPPPEVMEAVDEVIRRTADTRKKGPWTRSAFIIQAIVDKLKHIHRSNRKNRRRAVAVHVVGEGKALREFLQRAVDSFESRTREVECLATSTSSPPTASPESPESPATST